MTSERVVEGELAHVLTSGGPGGLEVTFVPGAGMVGCSLRHGGEELLGQRKGLRSYIEKRSTMGIPLLYPWANRLGARRFSVAGREAVLDLDGLPLSFDAAGLPIHGLLSAASGWELERHLSSDDGGELVARFDFAAQRPLMEAFPFPHDVLLEAELSGVELTITTTVHAEGKAMVPVSFGFHPYLRVPGVERSAWRVEIPVAEQLELDARMLPTGARSPVRIEPGSLADRTFDDAFVAPDDEAPFVLSGGGRRVELRMGEGYRFAQIYAPEDDDVIAFEPMTAPTNALVTGGTDLPLIAPGESFAATFSITVADDEDPRAAVMGSEGLR
jgi:galactose mutarotase-like enzyme